MAAQAGGRQAVLDAARAVLEAEQAAGGLRVDRLDLIDPATLQDATAGPARLLAAAVLLVGADRAVRDDVRGPDVVATRSRLYPGSGAVIGFRPSETGFRVILTAGVVDVIDANFADDATSVA